MHPSTCERCSRGPLSFLHYVERDNWGFKSMLINVCSPPSVDNHAVMLLTPQSWRHTPLPAISWHFSESFCFYFPDEHLRWALPSAQKVMCIKPYKLQALCCERQLTEHKITFYLRWELTYKICKKREKRKEKPSHNSIASKISK